MMQRLWYCLLLASGLGSATVASAETLTVTTLVDSYDQVCDSSDCSLRDAAYWFNNHDDAATTVLLPAGTFTIGRYETEPSYEKDEGIGDVDFKNTTSQQRSLVITGQGSENTILDGDGISGLLELSKVTATISELSVRNGSAQEATGHVYWGDGTDSRVTFGGGVLITNSTVTFEDCRFTSNQAYNGGAIYGEFATIMVDRCAFQQNQASSGGAILMGDDHNDWSGADNTLTLSDSVFEQNSAIRDGGAIDGDGNFALSVINTTFVDNAAGRRGGAIVHDSDCCNTNRFDFKVVRSQFGNNSAKSGGAIAYASDRDEGFATLITQSSFTENTAVNGGALYSTDDFGPDTRQLGYIRKSLFAHNSATKQGGAIYQTDHSTLHITNVTMSDNTAVTGGAAVYNGDTSKYYIAYSTIADNGTRAIHNAALARLIQLKGNIISDNTNNCYGAAETIQSLGYNVIDSESSCDGLDAASTDLFDSADLTVLSDNGGFTSTYALAADSVAIDLIPQDDCTDARDHHNIVFDQRNQVRPDNDRCDAGAYEFTE